MQVDANDVIDALLMQVTQLHRDLAIAQAALKAAQREAPPDK